MKIAMMILIGMVIATGSLYGERTEQPPPIPSEERPEGAL